MRHQKLTIILAASAMLLGACDSDGDIEFRGEYDNIFVDCDDSDQCWAKDPGWDAWAGAIINDQIDKAVYDGVLIETRDVVAGDQCWELAGTDGHLCIVYLGSAKLVGRPASELLLSPAGQACSSFDGVWTEHAEGWGMCFGIVDGVAVQLDVDPFY